ncbi:hypothetical protein OPT61_g9919 [Boeremia exigua]|uniref:Uncharacterized protein n=1 Tax=Boeremia exigua TaxID=749465 RepID=A0ACC2HSL3_9PLEO|nr:hypothetical protein OPT61_g9919 [Boeremia exigua]
MHQRAANNWTEYIGDIECDRQQQKRSRVPLLVHTLCDHGPGCANGAVDSTSKHPPSHHLEKASAKSHADAAQSRPQKPNQQHRLPSDERRVCCAAPKNGCDDLCECEGTLEHTCLVREGSVWDPDVKRAELLDHVRLQGGHLPEVNES